MGDGVHVTAEAQRRPEVLGTKPNLGPLKEQYVLLTIEPSLQFPSHTLLFPCSGGNETQGLTYICWLSVLSLNYIPNPGSD